MTFTLLARCPKTGQVGIGIATYSICVGLYCNGLRGNTGATMSQAFVNQGNNPLALGLLALGYSPEHVLDELKANDSNHAFRQIAVIDRLGRLAAQRCEESRLGGPCDRRRLYRHRAMSWPQAGDRCHGCCL